MDKHLYSGFIKPGKVFGNIYFVGTRPASTHIIDTGEGLILIDPGLPETLWIVLDNIKDKVKQIFKNKIHNDKLKHSFPNS